MILAQALIAFHGQRGHFPNLQGGFTLAGRFELVGKGLVFFKVAFIMVDPVVDSNPGLFQEIRSLSFQFRLRPRQP